ncbi:PREDICTED: metal tolerance protein 1-like [Tarenaya hassleriana]|uniref:metal tolerance protein 1-like n=1 Tax=Tarenaya hassleriana TaxID=28532 RepID=UPI00053C61E1|nr:PREDICTED: metal tolerance protein 1-like [Tarenaya hassleriana]
MSERVKELQMESQIQEHGHVVDICRRVSTVPKGRRGSKICGEAPCGFSDSKILSEDSDERLASMKKLSTAVLLCLIFMAVEVLGGIKANSLAVLTDAAHLLSDVVAFAISLFSLWVSGWEANPRQSYGFFRIEILSALASIQLIWLVVGIIVYEAVMRLIHETKEVKGSLMFAVSAFGLFVNIAMAVLLGHDHGHTHGHGHDHAQDNEDSEDGQAEILLDKWSEGEARKNQESKRHMNINVQGAYLHVLGDSIQSVGVMIGGAVIWYKPEWKVIDLICTLLFSAMVLLSTIRILRNILEVLMENTPREIDSTRLAEGICSMGEVTAIHELHVWAITVGKVLLSCHVEIIPDADADKVLDKIIDYIRREYNISHVTIQIEREQVR